jgi:hypothetical protein
LDKDDEDIPPHDYHIPSMSLPFVLNQTDVPVPYLKCDTIDLEYESIKIGIAWEGNHLHTNNAERSCPLHFFKQLKTPTTRLYVLQKYVNDVNLIKGCDDLELHGTEIANFMDTAKLINSVDVVVTVDTSVLHLAGALGIKTYGLLSYRSDPRWNIGQNWYPSVTLIRQRDVGDWEGVFCELLHILKENR